MDIEDILPSRTTSKSFQLPAVSSSHHSPPSLFISALSANSHTSTSTSTSFRKCRIVAEPSPIDAHYHAPSFRFRVPTPRGMRHSSTLPNGEDDEDENEDGHSEFEFDDDRSVTPPLSMGSISQQWSPKGSDFGSERGGASVGQPVASWIKNGTKKVNFTSVDLTNVGTVEVNSDGESSDDSDVMDSPKSFLSSGSSRPNSINSTPRLAPSRSPPITSVSSNNPNSAKRKGYRSRAPAHIAPHPPPRNSEAPTKSHRSPCNKRLVQQCNTNGGFDIGSSGVGPSSHSSEDTMDELLVSTGLVGGGSSSSSGSFRSDLSPRNAHKLAMIASATNSQGCQDNLLTNSSRHSNSAGSTGSSSSVTAGPPMPMPASASASSSESGPSTTTVGPKSPNNGLTRTCSSSRTSPGNKLREALFFKQASWHPQSVEEFDL